jgi:AraC family transcriptional regulator, regulatory protein of adaptative response / methylated-DNA-[protein]-cysteine methyltransferase
MRTSDFDRVSRALAYLEDHAGERPALEAVARAAGLSPFHFQRLFRRWAGVSPTRLMQYRTAQRAKVALRDGRTVLDTAYEVGLSGAGRLHDLLVAVDAVTPGNIRTAGAGLTIRWGHHATPFGGATVGLTDRGICALGFDERERGATVTRLHHDWPAARLLRDQTETARVVERIFSRARPGRPLTLHLRGTNFQLKVWEALLAIPDGTTTSYGDVAGAIGKPAASRAVGTAVGDNPVAFLVPCHRVLRASGAMGGYRWGVDRKQAMLTWEGVRRPGGQAVERSGR